MDGFIETFNIEPYFEGTLSSYTFAAKDVIDIEGHVTGCGNPSWQKIHSPSVAHAICVELLLQSGAHFRGKTISDEFAFSLLGKNDQDVVGYGSFVDNTHLGTILEMNIASEQQERITSLIVTQFMSQFNEKNGHKVCLHDSQKRPLASSLLSARIYV